MKKELIKIPIPISTWHSVSPNFMFRLINRIEHDFLKGSRNYPRANTWLSWISGLKIYRVWNVSAHAYTPGLFGNEFSSPETTGRRVKCETRRKRGNQFHGVSGVNSNFRPASTPSAFSFRRANLRNSLISEAKRLFRVLLSARDNSNIQPSTLIHPL